MRRYGVDNKELEEFTEKMRELVEAGSLKRGSYREYKGAHKEVPGMGKFVVVNNRPGYSENWKVRPAAMALYLAYVFVEGEGVLSDDEGGIVRH